MEEILRTNSLVLIYQIQSILNDAGNQNTVFNAYTSDIEGSKSII